MRFWCVVLKMVLIWLCWVLVVLIRFSIWFMWLLNRLFGVIMFGLLWWFGLGFLVWVVMLLMVSVVVMVVMCSRGVIWKVFIRGFLEEEGVSLFFRLFVWFFWGWCKEL